MRAMNWHPAGPVWTLGVLLPVLAAGTAAEETSVQVYECRQGGKVTFSDSPCVGQEQTLDLQYERPSAAAAAEATQTAIREGEEAWNQAEADVLDTQILNAAQQVANLESARDARIAALRAELEGGTPEPDATAWQARLNQEILTTTQDFNDNILAQRQRLDQLKTKRAALGNAPPPAPAPR